MGNSDLFKTNNPMYIINKNQSQQRLGEIVANNQGEEMQIIRYSSARDIDIIFLKTNNVVKNQWYGNFKKGTIEDKFLPTVFGKGIVGNELIKDNNKKFTKEYLYWSGMLKRCYSEPDLKRYSTYNECFVCDEWTYLSRFSAWFKNNYYSCGNEIMCLDKDILIKGNKIYSPETCILVPERINILFTKTNKNRGLYPIGVYYKEKNAKFVAQVSKLKNEESNTKQQEYLGLFNTPEEAFIAYKQEKEKYIKQIADMYRKKYAQFPQVLYKALYEYEVEITD